MSVILFILILIVLILVHEFGHFVVAKKMGIRVDEFGIGFPPKLFGKKYGETEYTVNALPFGGFVRIFGENPDEESLHGADKGRSFIHRPKWVQATVITAGVLFNVLLAWVLIVFGLMAGLPVSEGAVPGGGVLENARLTVISVLEDSPAAKAGLLPGDRILSLTVGGETVADPNAQTMQTFIQMHESAPITVSYTRGESDQGEISVTPERGIVGEAPAVGITMDVIGTVHLSFFAALWQGGKMTIGLLIAIVSAFGGLIASVFNGTADFSGLAGPVGIAGIVGDAADFGFIYLLSLTAFISLNLAVINLIPFPALDGGRLFFLLIEAVKGSPISPRITNFAHMFGFVVLIGLMLAVTYNDLVRLFS
ncbi:MAG: site-2 protease family protein [Parcubacteria group bacterium]|nr:site-2 protease family protein [Parcubacteria group bacterium]